MPKIRSSYLSKLAVLTSAGAVAQVISIAVMPILTRIYSPDEIGVWALYMSCVSVLSIVATGRYEVAIMAPQGDDEAREIFDLVVLVSLVAGVLIFFLVHVFHDYILAVLGVESIGAWLYFVPFAVVCNALYQAVMQWLNRKIQYKVMSIGRVSQSASSGAVATGLGFLQVSMGIIYAHIASLLFVLFYQFPLIAPLFRANKRQDRTSRVELLKRYSNFPRYTMFAGLSNSLSFNGMNFFVNHLFGMASLGNYSLATKILGAPSSLIGAAVGNVLFKDATDERREKGCAKGSILRALKILVPLSLLGYGVLYAVAEDFFLFLFGDNWTVAGQCALLLIPLYAIKFVISPLTLINIVFEKQKFGMLWQLGLLLLSVTIFLWAKFFDAPLVLFLQVYVWFAIAYYCYFLYKIYKHSLGE